MGKTVMEDDWKTSTQPHVVGRALRDPAFAHALQSEMRTLLAVDPAFGELSSAQLYDFLMNLRVHGVHTPHLMTTNLF
jgi:hypothetical protein